MIHVKDASQNPLVAAKLLNPATREDYIAGLRDEQAALRESIAQEKLPLVSSLARRGTSASGAGRLGGL